MTRPTPSPVQTTEPSKRLRRGILLIGLLSGAGLVAGLVWSATPSDRGTVNPMSLISVPGGREEQQGDPPSPAPTPTLEEVTWDQTFTSDLFGYTLRYPDGWTARPATSADLSDWIKAPLPSMTALSIRRIPRPDGAGLPAFADAHLPHRADHNACQWSLDGLDGLHEIMVDGRGGAYRSECGYVDAVVMEGDDLLYITLRSGQTRATGILWWFERFAENLDFSGMRPTPTPTPEDFAWDHTFTSDRFEFSIRYPEGWIPVKAIGSKPDRILSPPPSRTVLSIRRSPMREGEDFMAFAEEHLRHRAQPDGCHWNSAGIIFIPAGWDTLHKITIDGHLAAYRSECSHVDAVVQDGDEFFGITLESSTRKATGDLWWFQRFAEVLELPDDAGSAQP